MKKRLIAIAIAAVVAMPLTAQAGIDSYFESPTHQVSVSKSVVVPGSAGLAVTMSAIKTAHSVTTMAVGTGAGLYDVDPATVIASDDSCGSCHSRKGDVPSGVHGGGTIGISKTS